MILVHAEKLVALEENILGEPSNEKLDFISRVLDGSDFDIADYDLDEDFIAYVQNMKNRLQPISDAEAKRFQQELKQLDDRKIFDRIFGRSKDIP